MLAAHHAFAVDALLLQDTYVDNGTTGGKPPPNQSNYGAGMDLRVFKGNGRLGRAFLKFSLATLPPGINGDAIVMARLRLWINRKSTAAGSITLRPVTSEWSEYTLVDGSAGTLSYGYSEVATLPLEEINSFISVDITRLVKAWIDGRLLNHGIVIEPANDTEFLDLFFDSKESNETSHEARLEISLRDVASLESDDTAAAKVADDNPQSLIAATQIQ
jgi:hypothetical protein